MSRAFSVWTSVSLAFFDMPTSIEMPEDRRRPQEEQWSTSLGELLNPLTPPTPQSLKERNQQRDNGSDDAKRDSIRQRVSSSTAHFSPQARCRRKFIAGVEN